MTDADNAETSWTADNGNGTYSNPLFYEEFSDPDVIRVGDDYYLTGTTMHAMPGLPVLHSKDLVNWQLASYCFDRLDLAPAFRLQHGEIYGQGIWAPCIRYHANTLYVIANINGFGTQVFRSDSPNGPWTHNRLPTALHDVSVLFDDDGKVYAVFGAGDIFLTELKSDLTDVVPGTQRLIIKRDRGMGEGSHFYKIDGKYFIVSAIPGAHTDMVVARAESLEGPWEIERMVAGESLGVPTQNSLRATGKGPELAFEIVPSDPNAGGGLTLHQGGIVDTPSGQWWSIIMQDHGSVGRLSCLAPITWADGFPLVGLPGNLRRAPNTWLKPDTGHDQPPKPLFERSDNFDSGQLPPIWQWNHSPDDTKWSLTQKPGILRLHSLPSADFWTARNTLTQRAIGPESVVSVEVEAGGMKPGDVAGLALLNRPYAWIGLVRTDNEVRLETIDQKDSRRTTVAGNMQQVWLRAECNFDTETATFSWSDDGMTFAPIGDTVSLVFQLKTFQGVRYGLFHYNSRGTAGGYADFDNFTVVEPRSRGIERRIPLGKTVTFATVDGGSLLVANGNTLATVAANSSEAAAPYARFFVVDRGQGRVALRTSDNRYVSVSPRTIVLKSFNTPAGLKPDLSNAETFQWVNLLRGHTAFLSLVNHRYIVVPPNEAKPAAADAAGPSADRKGDMCFTWKVVE